MRDLLQQLTNIYYNIMSESQSKKFDSLITTLVEAHIKSLFLFKRPNKFKDVLVRPG